MGMEGMVKGLPLEAAALGTAILLFGGACGGPERGPVATGAPKKPPHVAPPRVESSLSTERLRDCLYREPLAPGALDFMYYSPEDLVQDQVEEVRSLEFETPSDLDMLAPKDFDTAVEALGRSPQAREELVTRSLAWTFGLVPHGYDVNQLLRGEGAGLLAGFYDPRTERVAIEEKGKLDVEFVVMAHELTHAAADQRFGLPTSKPESILDERDLARDALVEGDAMLSELRFVSRLGRPGALDKALKAQVDFKEIFKRDRNAGVPYLLIDNASFPYQWGVAFVCSVFKKKGWAGVNRMYSHPPTTTAEILFPERYLKGEHPQKPARLGRVGSPYRLVTEGSFGAAHLKAMFDAPGDEENSALSKTLARASAWGGGRFKMWVSREDDDDVVVGVSLREHRGSRGLLCDSMNRWYAAAFGNSEDELVADQTIEYADFHQDAVVTCTRSGVKLGMGPSLELARRIAGTAQ
jgi:hypothetical protein